MTKERAELQLATAAALQPLLPLVAAYHAFEGVDSSAEQREAALRTLLADPALGAIWLIVNNGELAGYIALCTGFSIEFGGRDAFIDEFFILPAQRGRGLGAEVLALIKTEAKRLGIRALHLEVARDNRRARALYARCGFNARERYVLMTARL